MQEYDVALKIALQGPARVAIRLLTGTQIREWLNIELPEVQNPRVDLLGTSIEGDLIHLELQSTNDPLIPFRMCEYCLRIFRRFRKKPVQFLLYVGEEPMRMGERLPGAGPLFDYHAVDIREWDSGPLLASPDVGDNVIAILARLRDRRAIIRTLVARIAALDAGERQRALDQVLILAGLRCLEEEVEEEVRKVPLLNDILENKVLGREYRRGLDKGHQEGRQEGRREEVLNLLMRGIEKRFGPVPAAAEELLASRSTPELEELALRLLDATSLSELLK